MSFLYPRVVSVSRPKVDNSVGAQNYSGVTRGEEDPVVENLPASIQLQRRSGAPDGKTPSDAYARSGFNILIPLNACALGVITERDIITDDLGKRYQVIGAYWNSLGYNLSTELLEA